MNEMFSQGGKGSTGILTNKQAVARHFGVKQSEVVYFSVGAALSGYKVIYDKESQRAYSLPADLGSGVTAISLSTAGVLVHSAGNVDLGALAVAREEYVTLPGSFATGVTINAKNELVVFTDGKYRWDGALPKEVPADSSPTTTGDVGVGKWLSVGDASLRADLAEPTGAGLIGFGYSPYINRNIGDVLQDIPTNKYFGAKCDGVTDDTVANQTALDWSADNKRDVIFVGKSCITRRLVHNSGSRVTHLGEIKPRDFSDDVVIEVKDDAWRDPYNDGITAIDTGDRVHIDGLCIAPDSVIDAVGILGTDGVDPIISRLRTFNMRRGGIKIVKGYGWNISNISIIAPFDQNNSHDYAGIRHETSDSFYSSVIVSGYTTGIDMPGNANQVSKAHCWGMSLPDRTTRNMLFGLKMSGSGNNIVQFYADSPKKIDKTQAASITNGGIGYVISGFNNTFLSPRNLSHQDCGLKYGKVFLISGSENTFISPLIGDYDYIEDDGFFTFTGSASPLNNYVYGGNMQSTYLYPIASGSYKPTVNIPCTYSSQIYNHNIIQKNVMGRVVITCNITSNSSDDSFYIQLPPYLSAVSGMASGSIINNLTSSVRADNNLFAVEPYVSNGKIYFRRLLRSGAADDIKQNMLNTGNAFFDISINAR